MKKCKGNYIGKTRKEEFTEEDWEYPRWKVRKLLLFNILWHTGPESIDMTLNSKDVSLDFSHAVSVVTLGGRFTSKPSCSKFQVDDVINRISCY